MFTLWAKTMKHNRLLQDITIPDDSDDRRTTKILHALTRICREFDLPEPIWLDSNIRDFKRSSKTRFTQDSFIETVPFDYLEIQILEEDP